MCPDAGLEISESVAPASVEVVDRNESEPLPSVPSTWFALPSAEGNVNVTLEATESGALSAT